MEKKRLGLILPSPNIHMEPQFNALQLRDVEFFATRIMLKETTEAALIEMENDLHYASQLIAATRPDAVAYCCTSGSFIRGDAFDQQIMQTIETNCACPAVTTSFAMREAMQTMGIKSVVLLTPYTDDINAQEVKYIESRNMKVVSSFGFQAVKNEPLVAITAQQWIDAAQQNDSDQADALFLSCTNTKAMPVVDELEAKLGKPVLTSNSVTLWALLRAIHYTEPVDGCGLLLSRYLDK